jgi:hypothetical protein
MTCIPQPNTNRFRRVLRAVVLLQLPLAGCAGLNDPYKRAGTWRPEGVNDANIVAMVTHPSDLTLGKDDPTSPGQLSAAAVRRLLTDKVKPLATTSIGAIAPATDAPASPGGGADSP